MKAFEKVTFKIRQLFASRGPRPVEWLFIVSGLFLALRYLWFMDDAFIYYRYVDNLVVLDLGLVYNQGEYVEGFSSPFWVLLLSLIRATGMNYLVITRLVTCATFLSFSWMLIEVNKRLSPESPVVNFPLAYLGLNYGVLCYFSSGLETPFVQVAAVAYALYILKPTSRLLQVILAVSPLVRPELLLPLSICFLVTWIRSKKFPLGLGLISAFVMTSWMTFRIYYYADLFPNPFYLKNMVEIRQGLIYLHETLSTYHFYSVTLIFSAMTYVLVKKGVNLKIQNRLIMLLVAASVGWYVVKIGGDARHYRYLAFPFCLAVCSCAGLLEHFLKIRWPQMRQRTATLTGVVLALAAFSFYPPQLNSHPLLSRTKHKIANKIRDAHFHRNKNQLKHSSWSRKVNIEAMRAYKEQTPEFEYKDVEAYSWCVTIYKKFNVRFVHSLGLTNAILSRVEMRSRRPAHKMGLKRLARDIAGIQKSADKIGPGMYRQAVENGAAPEWITDNLDTIELIERKTYNTHNLSENLGLAFTSVGKIKPPARKGNRLPQ